MIQKSVWSVQRILVFTTVALVFVGFFEKRKSQVQPNKKAITEYVSECDADEDFDDDLIGGGNCYLSAENLRDEHYIAEKSKIQNPAPISGKKGKILPIWMMYQQLKIDGSTV